MLEVMRVMLQSRYLRSKRCAQTISANVLKITLTLSLTNRELNSTCDVFETWTTTGSEHFACPDSSVSHIFKLIISNVEKILYNINVIV